MADLLSLTDVARQLNVSIATVNRLMKKGELTKIKIGKSTRFTQQSISNLIEKDKK